MSNRYLEIEKINALLSDLQDVRQDEKYGEIKGLIRKTMNVIRKNAVVIAEARVSSYEKRGRHE